MFTVINPRCISDDGVDDIYSSLPMDTAEPGLSEDGEIQVKVFKVTLIYG